MIIPDQPNVSYGGSFEKEQNVVEPQIFFWNGHKSDLISFQPSFITTNESLSQKQVQGKKKRTPSFECERRPYVSKFHAK